jgi:hypothetical protein
LKIIENEREINKKKRREITTYSQQVWRRYNHEKTQR